MHGSTSWLDHCLSSTAVHDSIDKISVVYDCISSDHHPLSTVSYVCSKLPNIRVESLNSTNFKWASVSEDEKQAYFKETEMRMLNLKIPSFAIYCKNELCTNEMHAAEITKFSQDITHVLLTSAKESVIGSGNQRKQSTSLYIPGWNGQDKQAHSLARNAYLTRRTCG